MNRALYLSTLLILLAIPAYAQPSPESRIPSDRESQVQADWLRQEEVRQLAPASPVSTSDDAAGACDGVKDGKWGFHTGKDNQPWWQVDLGAQCPIGRVVIFNRADSKGAAARASKLMLLLSSDGNPASARAWRTVYQHNGTVFFGATDNKPLVIPLDGDKARFVRLQLPEAGYFHLDEVEVYGTQNQTKNLALRQPADQCSVSTWSRRHDHSNAEPVYPVENVIERGKRLIADLREAGVEVAACEQTLRRVADAIQSPPPQGGTQVADRKSLYLEARWAVRKLALANPLLDFDRILFAKRAPGSFSHMSDQYYGWWSRPGGGICILEGVKGETPRVKCLTSQMPEGSFLRPDLSYDARRILFAYCKYYPNLAGEANKLDKSKLPEDGFYHVYEVAVDGTGLRRLTSGKYDDFDARYLPNGEIVFLSTRRGQFIQCGKDTAETTLVQSELPDSYVRCGGSAKRPVAVYTLHVMNADGKNVRAISPFENFEWTPSVASDGRILFARWDYVDRWNMPYMSLWSTYPDGTQLRMVYGNFTKSPHCIFEARSVPNSDKIIFTASAHHAITGGSLVLLDPNRGTEESDPITRLTPEVCFPEIEGWPPAFYANPYPLSERCYLTAWSDQPIRKQGRDAVVNALGLYLYDAFGDLELLYRDPEISSMYPIPLRPRRKPPVLGNNVAWDGPAEGRFLLMNVYDGLYGVERGEVERLRIVGVPAKTQPNMNSPNLGITRDDPGKFVLGTVPVEEDGSAHFRVPAGVSLFFQALDSNGLAIQTMRSVTYVQPDQTFACVGCHEPRNSAPPNMLPIAASRPPSKITPGPEGSWPMRFDHLVQPVLDRYCVSCHQPNYKDKAAAKFDLTPAKAYDNLIAFGRPSLRDHVKTQYREGKSAVGACTAKTSALLALLREGKGHYDVELDADSFARLATWMDTYAQRQGSFSPDQEERLCQLRVKIANLMEK